MAARFESKTVEKSCGKLRVLCLIYFRKHAVYTIYTGGTDTACGEKVSGMSLARCRKNCVEKKQQKEHLQKIMVVGYRLAFIYFHSFYCLRGMTKRKDRATRVCCRICTKISETVAK